MIRLGPMIRLWRARSRFHLCACCRTWNRSVGYWPFKFGGAWLCGECAWGLCNADCGGVPYRWRNR